MRNAMRMGILAVTIVLLASVAVLASPASADGTQDDAVPTGMSAEEFLKLVGEGKSIVMDKDVKLTSALKIATEIELDLNGHKLVSDATHTIWVADGGKLTVKGAGTVDCQKHGCAALYVDVGGKATLNGGTFERSKETALEINGASVSNVNSWYTIYNDGTLTINKGVSVKNYVLKSGEKLGNASSLIINGTKADATLTINGGTFEGGLYIKNEVKGVATINDGTFSGIASWSLFNYNEMTINGGTFVGKKGIVCNCSVNTDPIELTITGGKFTWGQDGNVDQGLVDIYPSDTKSYIFDVTVAGIASGRNVFTAEMGEVITGTFSVNGQKIEMKDIKAGEGFALAVGSIDIQGPYTSDADGSIVVNGDAKLSGTIDSSVTVKVASGSITVPEGKTLAGTIQMGEGNKVELSVTAGKSGLTVTPTAIGGATTGTGSIDITGKVSVKGALTLGEVELTVPADSVLTVPKGASVSGGKVENAGSIVVDGAVESIIANSGKVSAAVDAKVSDVDGGDFEQAKPVIERKVFDANVPVGGLVTFSVTVTDGASVKLTGAEWASYKDGVISGKPTETGEYKITATPYIGDNVGESIVFTVNVFENTDPVTPVDPEKEKEEGSFDFVTVAIVLIVAALLLFAVTRFI